MAERIGREQLPQRVRPPLQRQPQQRAHGGDGVVNDEFHAVDARASRHGRLNSQLRLLRRLVARRPSGRRLPAARGRRGTATALRVGRGGDGRRRRQEHRRRQLPRHRIAAATCPAASAAHRHQEHQQRQEHGHGDQHPPPRLGERPAAHRRGAARAPGRSASRGRSRGRAPTPMSVPPTITGSRNRSAPGLPGTYATATHGACPVVHGQHLRRVLGARRCAPCRPGQPAPHARTPEARPPQRGHESFAGGGVDRGPSGQHGQRDRTPVGRLPEIDEPRRGRVAGGPAPGRAPAVADHRTAADWPHLP